MKTFSDNEIREKFNKLSPSLKEAIYSSDIAEVIVAMSGKYGITEKRVANVAGEIGYVILGLIKPEELPSRLSERLEIKPDDAALLAKDAYQSVLKPLAAEIKRLYGLELNENVFGAKPPSPAAPHAELQKPPTLVIPPRPVLQQAPSDPRRAPFQPVAPPPQPVPPPPQQAPKPTMPSPPPSQAPVKPLNIPRQAPMPPPAPPPALPPEQTEPRPPSIARAPLAPPMPPQPNAPRESMIAPPLPKPQTPPRTQVPRSIFSPQTPGPLQPPPPLEPPRKDLTSARPAQSSEPRVFAPKHPTSPRDLDDPYRETVTQQEKELQQKRDQVSNPRAPEPPFQVRKGEPPYVNPKIPPIDLREDATRPPKPPDPHWEKLQ